MANQIWDIAYIPSFGWPSRLNGMNIKKTIMAGNAELVNGKQYSCITDFEESIYYSWTAISTS